jgi:hypothetical protein
VSWVKLAKADCRLNSAKVIAGRRAGSFQQPYHWALKTLLAERPAGFLVFQANDQIERTKPPTEPNAFTLPGTMKSPAVSGTDDGA